MENFFLQLLNMSITAGWLVLAVMVLRLVFRQAPKWIHCLLWALVAVRLVCPFSIESAFSLVPTAEPVNTYLSGTPLVGGDASVTDTPVTPMTPITPVAPVTPGVSDAPVVSTPDKAIPQAASWTLTEMLALVWAVGVVAMLLYAVIATLRLRLQVRESVRLQDNVWQCDRISTPFILGVFRPRIYLPSCLSGRDTHSVLAHEQAHLKRNDHWWKPFGFLLLAVYWFHPLLWVGYVLLCRDIEAACDQRVIRDMDVAQRKIYSQSLLACSAPRHLISACPLAFGETAVKSRVKTVLNYKKPAFWLVLVAVIASAAVAVCLLTDPKPAVAENPTDKVENPTIESVFYPQSERFSFSSMNWMDEDELDESNLPVTAIRSVEELNTFIEKYDNEMGFTRNYSTGSGPAGQMLEVYTEEFFHNNAVLAVYYKNGCCSMKPKVIGIRKGDGLQVMIDVDSPSVSNCALGQWFLMVNVSREELDRATAVTAQVRGYIAVDTYAAAFEKATKYPDEGVELWRERLSAEEQDYLRGMLSNLAWGEKGIKATSCAFLGSFNYGGETYYVSSDYTILCTKEQMAYLTTEDGEFLRVLYQPRGAVTHVPPYRQEDSFATQITTKVPEKNYWQTFSHPLHYTEAVKMTGGYQLEQYDIKKLQQILDEVEWKFGPAQDALFLSDAYFCLDGETRYYVYMDTVAGYSYLALDQDKHAPLTEEQENVIEGLVCGGVTAKATHYLSGYYAEWNKAGRYFVLDVVWADDETLVGKKIRVNTKNTLGRCTPHIGTMLEVAYDGVVVNNDMVYAMNWNEQDDSSLPDGGDVNASGTFTGKVIHVADGAVLINCYDKNQFDTVWVLYGNNYPDLTPQMNEEYQVVFNGQAMETYPPQVIAEGMTRVSSTPLKSDFIREERAIEIAVEYWNVQLGVPDQENGYFTTVYVMETPTEETPLYKMGSRRVAEKDGAPGNSALYNTIYIDAVTGAIVEDIPDQS